MIEFLSENSWIIQAYLISMSISVFYYALIYDAEFTIDQFFGAFFPFVNTLFSLILMIMFLFFIRKKIQKLKRF